MKQSLPILTLLSFLFFFSSNGHSQSQKDSFYVKKYDRMIEIDVKGFFSYGPGTGLIYRKKHETGNFVFVDRTRYWRFGAYISGEGAKATIDSISPNVPVNINYNGYFGLFLKIGHETMFHFGKFNLFYAIDLNPNYYYQDIRGSKTPCIANSFGLGVSLAGGMRYYFNNRFSLSVESVPFSVNVYNKIVKYYTPILQNGNYGTFEPFKVNEKGINISQAWLSSLGFTYHF
jgi:hypothetical protein